MLRQITGSLFFTGIALFLTGCGTPKATDMQLASGISYTEKHPTANLDKIKEQIASGRNVNEKGWGGETALRTAISSAKTHPEQRDSYLQIADYLLDHDADPNATSDINPASILMVALSYQYKELAQKLITKGADINYVDAFGRTALSSAASTGDADMVEFLLSRVSNKRAQAQSALVDCAYGLSSVQNGSSNQTRPSDNKKFQFAAIFEMLLKAGADINTPDKRGLNALRSAVYGADPEIVHYLIKNNANPNVKVSNQNAIEYALDLRQYRAKSGNLEEQKRFDEIIEILKPVTSNAAQITQVTPVNDSTHAGLDAVAECLKLKAALKVCENIPWPASLGCNALAKSNYGNSYCPM